MCEAHSVQYESPCLQGAKLWTFRVDLIIMNFTCDKGNCNGKFIGATGGVD